jgi:hypothetical protein
MTQSASGTASDGLVIERHVRAGEEVAESYSVVIGGDPGIAGLTDPMLTDPIDFDAELAERSRTHVPLEPVDGDQTNSIFGI